MCSEYTMSTSTAFYYTNRCTSYQTSTVSIPCQHLLLSTILTDALHIRQVQWVNQVNIYCFLLYSQTHFISDKYSEYTMSTSTAIYYTNRRTSYQTSTVSKPSQHLLTHRRTSYQTSTVSKPSQLLYEQMHFISDKYSEYSTSTAL